jgi:hypothetical protein
MNLILSSVQIQLADTLLQMERKLQVESPLNIYRKHLGNYKVVRTETNVNQEARMCCTILCVVTVCDVLPLVLKAPLPADRQKSVVEWLQKAVEFLVVSAAHSSHTDNSRSRGGEVTGEAGLHVTNSWQRLQELMTQAATQLSWPQMPNRTPRYLCFLKLSKK